MDQNNLFSKLAPHPYCEGCPILDKKKAKHCVLRDQSEFSERSDIVFVSDSFKYREGEFKEFTSQEMNLIIEAIPSEVEDITFISAVNCPSLTDKTIKVDGINKCRRHLIDQINYIKPKLIFACGNLALRVLTKHSGITKRRGSEHELSKEFKEVIGCEDLPVVVPTFHPFSVFNEPKNKYLFQVDIKNGINKYINKIKSDGQFSYEPVLTIEDFERLKYIVEDSSTIAVDIETTGLNFLLKEINSIAFSTDIGTIAIPLFHKDTPFTDEELAYILSWIGEILKDESKEKIFHNCKFDLKFLYGKGLRFKNIWDTKFMAHLIKEDRPKSLMDLVKEFYPEELEKL